MKYAIPADGGFQRLYGQPFALDGVQYPGNVIDLWSAEDLAAIGVLAITPAAAPPEGESLMSIELELVDGQLVEVGVYGQRPLPPEVPMHKILKAALITPWAGHANLDAAIRVAFASLPHPQNVLALAEYERAPNFVTAGVTTQNTKAALGMTDQQFRDLVLLADSMA
ncbi:hypothetical protein J2X45_003410 [Caulobacter sp. BE264]|uniref:hypothetical protein n=1 Tax=Caulobacter sp. BE264 TaxID=2817724 RepID=UPI00285491E6|nr:hypothetical protein [Caulobacter sp. BE264]MDR7232304.1 hypothetical protein [Caulobacter sp. BE264]